MKFVTSSVFILSVILLASCAYHKAAPEKVEVASPTFGDWPTYNKTLASERFADLDQINTKNVAQLKVVCEFDSKEEVSFQTGLVQTEGALFATTEHDTFSIDPNTCKQNWRAHETFKGAMLKVNRGVAYMDGRVFRGTADGRVLAYDAKTGKKLWAQTIGDAKKGESINASPIAENGLVYIGNAGGDNKGVKGRMYALHAETGKIAWEFYLVPKQAGDKTRGPSPESPSTVGTWKNPKGYPITGGGVWTSFSLDPATQTLYVPGGNPAPDFVRDFRDGENLFAGSVIALDANTGNYKQHFPIVLDDFHDYDVSSAPAILKTAAGRSVMVVTPKDGHMYLYDLTSGKQTARLPMTTIFNEKTPLEKTGTRFCPGTQGGSEWNGPSYSPKTNLVYSGQVDWCATVRLDTKDTLKSVASGQPWTGTSEGFGKFDDQSKWAGWIVAVNPDSAQKAWTYKAEAPILGAVTATAGGFVIAGDMVGNFFALDAASGQKLWATKVDGAIGGGVISYNTGAGQKIAVATGMTSKIWPTKKTTGKILILGL